MSVYDAIQTAKRTGDAALIAETELFEAIYDCVQRQQAEIDRLYSLVNQCIGICFTTLIGSLIFSFMEW